MALVVDETKTKLVKLPTTPMSVVLSNLREISLEAGKVTRLAQVAIRRAITRHALTLGQETHTRMMTLTLLNFGLRKFFSLDIGDVADVVDVANNLIGFVFPRSSYEAPVPGEPHPRQEAASLVDTLDCCGLQLNKVDKRGNVRYTKYMTFAEHPVHDNEISFNLATEDLTIRTGVRWWDSALQQHGGVPLVPPPGFEDREFAVIDDEWHDEDDVPLVNQAAIEHRFPIYQDKHYR